MKIVSKVLDILIKFITVTDLGFLLVVLAYMLYIAGKHENYDFDSFIDNITGKVKKESIKDTRKIGFEH